MVSKEILKEVELKCVKYGYYSKAEGLTLEETEEKFLKECWTEKEKEN